MNIYNIKRELANILPVRFFLILSLLFSFLFILKPITYEIYPDFGSYYYAAENLLSGINPYGGSGPDYGFFLYPPPSILLFIPLSYLSSFTAGKIFTIFSVLSLLTSLYLLLKLINVKPFSNLGMLLITLSLNFFPAKFTLGMGQINNFILLVVVLFIYHFKKGKFVTSGRLLSLGFLLKVWPAILIVIPIIYKQWKTIWSFLMITLLVFLLSYFFIGEKNYNYYFHNTLPGLFTNIAGDYYNQSLSAFLLSHLDGDIKIDAFKLISGVLLLTPVVYYAAKFYKAKKDILPLYISMLIIMSLILTNNAWQHHFVWLMIPMFLIFGYIKEKRIDPKAYIVLLVCYFLVALNLKDPASFPQIFQFHVFYGAILLYCLNLYLLNKSRITYR